MDEGKGVEVRFQPSTFAPENPLWKNDSEFFKLRFLFAAPYNRYFKRPGVEDFLRQANEVRYFSFPLKFPLNF